MAHGQVEGGLKCFVVWNSSEHCCAVNRRNSDPTYPDRDGFNERWHVEQVSDTGRQRCEA